MLSPAGAWSRPRDLDRLVRLFRLGALLGRPWWVRRLAVAPRLRRLAFLPVMQCGDRMTREDALGFFSDLGGCSAMSSLLSAAAARDGIAPFDHLPCPVRVAWAERDRVIPYRRYGAPLRTALPGAEFVRLSECGHVPMWDAPDLVARTVLDVTVGPARPRRIA